MGKSPGKWIKTVLFGKKSSKSNLSKDATIERKASITAKAPSGDMDLDSMVISNPVPQIIDTSGANTELETTANLTCDAVAGGRGTIGLNSADDTELSRQQQAAIKAQAAFRGYLARRAFWALKGIIRLQALVRGHLVRRQAVATLRCMRAIVEFQALVRGRRVRLSGAGHQVLEKYTRGELLVEKRVDLLGTSLKSEKLSTNAFGTKLLASSPTIMPLSIQYDPVEPNSVSNWLERWSSSRFWEPLGRPQKMLDAKPKRKQAKLQTEETEAGRPKRSVRRVPATNGDSNLLHSSENEKSKRNARKVSSHQTESVQEQHHNELEKVKRNLRKISASTSVGLERSEAATEKPQITLEKVSGSPTPDVSEQGLDPTFEKVSDSSVAVSKHPEPEAPPILHAEDKPLDVQHDDHPAIELYSIEMSVKVENSPNVNEELNSKEDQATKENQRTRRRKSFPAKQECPESVSQNSPTLPSYMAATESAKAKLRAQGSPRTTEDEAENGFIRRHSLPSSNFKLSLQSPRIQRPLQANGKGGSKSNKSLTSSRDGKVLQAGWKR